jgi:hypothetical protein
MTGDRARMAPEMTPAVEAADEATRMDRRGVVRDTPPGTEPAAGAAPDPGSVPGIGGEVEGRTQLTDTTGAERTDEGGGRQRRSPNDGAPSPVGDDSRGN